MDKLLILYLFFIFMFHRLNQDYTIFNNFD